MQNVTKNGMESMITRKIPKPAAPESLGINAGVNNAPNNNTSEVVKGKKRIRRDPPSSNAPGRESNDTPRMKEAVNKNSKPGSIMMDIKTKMIGSTKVYT